MCSVRALVVQWNSAGPRITRAQITNFEGTHFKGTCLATYKECYEIEGHYRAKSKGTEAVASMAFV